MVYLGHGLQSASTSRNRQSGGALMDAFFTMIHEF